MSSVVTIKSFSLGKHIFIHVFAYRNVLSPFPTCSSIYSSLWRMKIYHSKTFNDNVFVEFLGVVFSAFLSDSWFCKRCVCLTLIRQTGLDIIHTTASHSGQWSGTPRISDFFSTWQEAVWNRMKCNSSRLPGEAEHETSNSQIITEPWQCWKPRFSEFGKIFHSKSFSEKQLDSTNFPILINFAS